MSMNVILIDYVNSLAGHHLPCQRRYEWQTDIIPLSGGRRHSQRNQVLEQPIRHWFINWQALLASEQERFLEIFNRAKGAHDTFLLMDRDPGGDHKCSNSDWSHTAAAGETATQLQKTYYPGTSESWTEDRTDIVPGDVYAPTIRINGVAQTEGVHFTLSDTTGIIDWTGGSSPHGAMAGGEIIQADYEFYFRVRLTKDSYDQIRNIPTYWEIMGLELVEDE